MKSQKKKKRNWREILAKKWEYRKKNIFDNGYIMNDFKDTTLPAS